MVNAFGLRTPADPKRRTPLLLYDNAVMGMLSTMSAPATGDQPEVRRRLLEEAARILGEEGPSAPSARRLASDAGTSTMAVDTHFGAMSALVDEVATEGFRRLIDHVGDVGDHLADTLDDLPGMAVAYRDNALENRHLYAVDVRRGERRRPRRPRRGPGGVPRGVRAARGRRGQGDGRRERRRGGVARGGGRAVLERAARLRDAGQLAGINAAVGDPEHTVLWQMLANLLAALGPEALTLLTP